MPPAMGQARQPRALQSVAHELDDIVPVVKIALAQLNLTLGDLAGNAARIVGAARSAQAAGASLLVIRDAHVIETGQLPAIHEDPFDRLLIAQARLEGLMAVSADAHWPAYDLHLHRA